MTDLIVWIYRGWSCKKTFDEFIAWCSDDENEDINNWLRASSAQGLYDLIDSDEEEEGKEPWLKALDKKKR